MPKYQIPTYQKPTAMNYLNNLEWNVVTKNALKVIWKATICIGGLCTKNDKYYGKSFEQRFAISVTYSWGLQLI